MSSKAKKNNDQATDENVADIEPIVPHLGQLKIGGIDVEVRKMNAWDVIAFARVVTTGAAPALGRLTMQDNEDELAGQIMSVLIVAIPNAELQFKLFTRRMIQELDSRQGKALDSYVDEDLTPDELWDILSVVVEQEKGNLFELWGKIRAQFNKETQNS